MMDKKTILVVAICILALFLSQAVINKMYPPHAKAVHPPAAAGSNAVPQPATAATPAQPAIEPAKETKPAPSAPAAPRPPEQIVSLSNDFIRVDFTSWGGGVRTVELLRHKGPSNDVEVLNGTNLVPALSLVGVPGAGSNDAFSIQAVDARTVQMRSDNGVVKTVTLSNDYLMAGSVQLPAALAPSGTVGVVIGTAQPTQPHEIPNYLVVDWENASKFNNRTLPYITKRLIDGKRQETISAGWIAVKSQYFTMVLSPVTNVVGFTCAPVDLPTPPPPPTNHGLTATATIPFTRAGDGSLSCAFSFYAGPKDYNRLAALGKHQEELMDLGTPMDFYSGLFGVILLHSLNYFHGLIPNYGVAIILVTIALKVIFWPIQAKSIQSMKAMQKFQPLMNKLREKYKDDPQKLNTEMMKLYKEHKINPFSGCLPVLIQLPVLIAFYRVLLYASALRGAPFLWIHDLSQPDTIFTIAGLQINPLPLAMTAGTFFQQKMTPTGGDPQQQKMMMFMPVMMLFFFYKLAAGLTLYYTLQQLLSLLQQWRSMRQRDDAAAVAVPAGKGK
ncbi:MAG TPA: membrane protein insertase YidC [Verrucomicrobiae bacterium]|nr:membrane protein insertase YidC [Verrucomicrobiae bacterium]